MKASVVIPTKNAGIQFKAVIEAVLAQKTPWSYDVLVIDSGSTDSTVEYVKSLSNVKLHQISPREFGHGKTRNLGVTMTSGEFVVMLTHDALPVSDDWLFELVTAVEQDEEIAGAFGRHIAYEHDGPFLKRDLALHFDGFLQWPSVVRLDDQERYQVDQGYRQFLHFFSDNNACLRRTVWEKIPYPEVDFAEDQLWAERVIEAGYSKAFADKAVVFHSHSFNFIEWGRRSFDESRALNRLFGYKLCSTLRQMLGQSFRITLADYKFLVKEQLVLSKITWIIKTPFNNIFRQLGYYLGQRADSLPPVVVRIISRDMTLQRRQ